MKKLILLGLAYSLILGSANVASAKSSSLDKCLSHSSKSLSKSQKKCRKIKSRSAKSGCLKTAYYRANQKKKQCRIAYARIRKYKGKCLAQVAHIYKRKIKESKHYRSHLARSKSQRYAVTYYKTARKRCYAYWR